METPFLEFVEDFAKACYTRSRLKNMRTGVLSRMCGMGDILTDEMEFLRQIGPEMCHDTIGSVYSLMEQVTKEEIDGQIEYDRSVHEVDPRLTYESHAEAAKMYLGFRRYLENQGFDAFTAQFDQFKDDGRFRQLPLYAASNLLADGYGYAAEGIICVPVWLQQREHLEIWMPILRKCIPWILQKGNHFLPCRRGKLDYGSERKKGSLNRQVSGGRRTGKPAHLPFHTQARDSHFDLPGIHRWRKIQTGDGKG